MVHTGRNVALSRVISVCYYVSTGQCGRDGGILWLLSSLASCARATVCVCVCVCLATTPLHWSPSCSVLGPHRHLRSIWEPALGPCLSLMVISFAVMKGKCTVSVHWQLAFRQDRAGEGSNSNRRGLAQAQANAQMRFSCFPSSSFCPLLGG